VSEGALPEYRYLRFGDGRFAAFDQRRGFHVTDAAQRTYFELAPTLDGKAFLRCAHGSYLSATPAGAIESAARASGWEAFSLDAHDAGGAGPVCRSHLGSDRPVALRSHHGTYLDAVAGADHMVLTATRPGPARSVVLVRAFDADRHAAAVRGTAPFAATDRVVWTFWHRGHAAMPPFCRLNVALWRRLLGPGWQVVVLDVVEGSAHHVDRFLDRRHLPRTFDRLGPVVQSDAVRLALLKTRGGVWMDPSIVLLRDLDDLCARRMAEAGSEVVMAGFANAAWGSDHLDQRDCFEGWFIAARRDNAFFDAWHQTYVAYWDDRTESTSSWSHPLFDRLDLSSFQRHGCDFRNYLLPQVAFRRVIEHDPHMKEMWRRNMLLRDAGDEAFLLTRTTGWNARQIRRTLIDHLDEDLAARLLATPLVKLTGSMRRDLEALPEETLLDPRHTLGRLYRSVLERP
jgi:hypothetical protein